MNATPVENYDQLVQVLRARIAELGIVFDTVDSIAGLPSRYAAKLLSNEPIKHLGAVSLFPVLAALGLRIRLEPDDQAIEKLSKRSDWFLMVRNGPRYRPPYNRRRRISARSESPDSHQPF